jgi:GTP pyrophosphokinase
LNSPAGATPVDFAYAVHTEVGHQCVGAKVNGHMVALRHEIASGDVVEIVTHQKATTPVETGLSFVKSSHAKSKIATGLKSPRARQNTEMRRRSKKSRAPRPQPQEIDEADILRKPLQSGDSPRSKIYTLRSALENILLARY